MPALYLALVFLLAGMSASHAQQTWTATSTASIAITGDITVSRDRIIFDNGQSIGLRPVGSGKPGIYRVDPPANPVLNNGNRLCGDEAPTFIALGRAQDSASLDQSNSLHLKIFRGSEPPPESAAIGMAGGGPGRCALLNYERANKQASGREAPLDRRATRQSDAVEGPSFDCRKAGTAVEGAICGSLRLSALDAELAHAYQARKARLSGADAKVELARQRAWLARRGDCGPDPACLERTYRSRIGALRRDARN